MQCHRNSKKMTNKIPNLPSSIAKRFAIIDSLAWIKSEPIDLADQLDGFEFGWSDSTYTLTQAHFENAFEKWKQNEISAQSLVNWAEALEVREDVDIRDPNEKVEDELKKLMLTLSNPDLFYGSLEQLSKYCYEKLGRILINV
jgi:hypothetical protein